MASTILEVLENLKKIQESRIEDLEKSAAIYEGYLKTTNARLEELGDVVVSIDELIEHAKREEAKKAAPIATSTTKKVKPSGRGKL